MITWAAVTALFAVVLAGVPIAWTLWQKHGAKMCEEERQWRDAQAAQLKSVEERLKAQIALEPEPYPDLPKVRLAGLLAPRREAPFEWR